MPESTLREPRMSPRRCSHQSVGRLTMLGVIGNGTIWRDRYGDCAVSLWQESRRPPRSCWAIDRQLPVSTVHTQHRPISGNETPLFSAIKRKACVPPESCFSPLADDPESNWHSKKEMQTGGIQECPNSLRSDPCLRGSSGDVLAIRDRGRYPRFVRGIPTLAATIVIATFLTTSAIAQEQHHAYSEYTCWFGGAFGNGHAFSDTVDGRSYHFENRCERLIYWSETICSSLGFPRNFSPGRRSAHWKWSPFLV
jgi:hypothetical protein